MLFRGVLFFATEDALGIKAKQDLHQRFSYYIAKYFIKL